MENHRIAQHLHFHEKTRMMIAIIAILLCLTSQNVFVARSQAETVAEHDELDELTQLLDENVFVTGTRTRETVLATPVTATVITARQLRDMGASTVTEALRMVAGIETFIDEYGYTQVVIRGGRMEGERVKFLINGHAVNPPRTGQPAIFFDDLAVENIQRIEIIRGPGSALYGANAMNGVINIITKTAQDVNGYEWRAKGGNHGTRDVGFLFGKMLADLNISGYMAYSKTDGPDVTFNADSQTVLDRQYAPYGIPAVSLAPGKADASREKTDLNLHAAYHDFTLSAKYLKKIHGPYLGANFALNRDSEWDLEYLFIEGQYTRRFSEKGEMSLKLYWDRVTEDYNMQGSPEGFTIPVDIDGDGDIEIFPDGARGRLLTHFDIFGGELQGTYQLGDAHLVVGGGEVQNIRQFDNIATTNFARLTLAALEPGERDTSPMYDNISRTIGALFLQDQWKFSRTATLTLGVRYDRYSDFGGTTNPRAAFVWNPTPEMYVKLLYGKAFLAPSFHEYYLKNNPLIVGSNQLKPATIETIELGVSYQFSQDVTAAVSYFHNAEDNVIIPTIQTDPGTPGTFINAKGDVIHGLECEVKAEFGEHGYGYANYTYRDTSVHGGDERVPFISRHLAKAGISVPVTQYVNVASQVRFVGEKPRETDDERSALESYFLADAAITIKNFYKGLECVLSLSNLFNKTYFDPSFANSFPGDFPMPGREIFFEIRYALSAK